MDKSKNEREMNRSRVRRHRAVQREMKNELQRYADQDENVCEQFSSRNIVAIESSLSPRSIAEYNSPAEENIELQHRCLLAFEELEDDGDNSFDEAGNTNALDPVAISLGNNGAAPEIEQIHQWALECNIRQVHLDKLLNILRVRLLPELPKASKTFLRTNSMPYDIQKILDVSGNFAGSYVYFGVESGLRLCVNPVLHPEKVIYLQINVDGLPIYTSSKMQFWPILCKIFCNFDVYKPFMIALFCGEAKPHCVNSYLQDFVNEMNTLSRDGIDIHNECFAVRIQCFICDTPARAFMKQTKGHGGFSACERCTVRGSRVQNRTVYPNVDSPERTDESFRSMQDRQHHNGHSVLTTLFPSINLVTFFVLDFMHLCCIGVTKRLLIQHWLSGNLRVRLSQRSKAELSGRLEALHNQIPADFQRKTRGLQFAAQWKATEFRFLLLYCGPIVLRHILPKKLYKHFLLLHMACRILCTDEIAQVHNATAKLYLRRFVRILPCLYGDSAAVLNMHNLIHIADDAKNMGCALNRITAFPFESFLGRLKKLIRTPNQPLEQVCRRLYEQCFFIQERAMPNCKFTIIKRDRHVINGLVYVCKMKYMEFLLTTNAPDDIVLLKNKRIAKILSVFYHEESPNDLQVEYAIWKVKGNIFDFPSPSHSMWMWELKTNYSSTALISSIDIIEQKMVKLALPMRLQGSTKVFAMPLLHH